MMTATYKLKQKVGLSKKITKRVTFVTISFNGKEKAASIAPCF